MSELTSPVAPSAAPHLMDALLKPTIILCKPSGIPWDGAAGLITAASQANHDRSGIDVDKVMFKDHHCVTPLETGASGLVVLTLDHTIKRQLITDAVHNEHEFMIEVQGEVSPEVLQALQRPKMHVSISKQNEHVTGLRFALKRYEAGRIAQHCAHVGLDVMAMKRLRLGRMPVAGLKDGQWRFLMGYERF